jgi:hypothetical protein
LLILQQVVFPQFTAKLCGMLCGRENMLNNTNHL